MHFVSSITQKYLPADSGLLPVSAQEVSCHFKNIDFSRFKPNVDPQQLLQMLTWMAEGYIQDKLRQSETLNIDELMQDFHSWQEMFRKIAYKEEDDENDDEG